MIQYKDNVRDYIKQQQKARQAQAKAQADKIQADKRAREERVLTYIMAITLATLTLALALTLPRAIDSMIYEQYERPAQEYHVHK